MSKLTPPRKAASNSENTEPENQGLRGFIDGDWDQEPRLNDLKLHFCNFLVYIQDMKNDEINKIFNQLTELQKEQLANIMAEFVSAVGDKDTVPMLFKVPRGALETGGTIRIPASALSEDALRARRASDVKNSRKYRSQLSEEQQAEARRKAAERMRNLRQQRNS